MRNLLKKLKSGWMKFAFVLGTVNSYILLTFFYIFILGIYAISNSVYKLFSIKRLSEKETYWKPRHMIPPTLKNLEKLF